MDITFQILSSSTCNHVDVQMFVNGALEEEFRMSRSELTTLPNEEERRVAMLSVLRNFIKENGLNTPAKIKSGVEAHVFKF